MKKLLKILSILLFISIVLCSCSKKDENEPAPIKPDPTLLYGKWTLTNEYTIVNGITNIEDNSYTDIMTLTQQNTITRSDGSSSEYGTYVVSGNMITETIDNESDSVFWKIINGKLYLYANLMGFESGGIYTKVN